MNMKKVTAVLMVVCLMAALGGCGQKPEVPTEPIEPSTEVTENTAAPSKPTEESISPNEPETTQPSTEETLPEATETTPTIENEPIYTEVDEIVYATTKVNIRSGPSTDYEKVGALSFGESIRRIGIGSDGWSKVIHNEETAYMYTEYLSTEKPVEKAQNYPLTYSDESCSITITKEWFEDAYCYIAHLEFSDYSRFGTACANGAYGSGYETTSHAASRLGAIFSVNGCYSAPELDYITVRSGEICNGSGRTLWCPAVYSSENGLLLSAWETSGTAGISGHNISTLVAEKLVTDTFCFGPPILSNGTVNFSTDTSRAQRTFIGTSGDPGDLWIVVSEGRNMDGVSAGLTYNQCARLLAEKGCFFGVPLDGGGSSTMVFQGEVLNSARNNERSVVDFVYFR